MTVCNSATGWMTRASNGQGRQQTVYSELHDGSVCPAHTEQPAPPCHGAAAPELPPAKAGAGARAGGLLRAESGAGSSLTSNPRFCNHPFLHSFPPPLVAPQAKLTLLMDQGTSLLDLPGQEQKILERTGQPINPYSCYFWKCVFCISL